MKKQTSIFTIFSLLLASISAAGCMAFSISQWEKHGVPWKNADKGAIYFLVSLPSPCTVSLKQWMNLGIISVAQQGHRAGCCLPAVSTSSRASSSFWVPPHAAHLHGTAMLQHHSWHPGIYLLPVEGYFHPEFHRTWKGTERLKASRGFQSKEEKPVHACC